MSFISDLEYGVVGESRILRWLRRHGRHVLPVYEKIMNDNKGPRMFMADFSELVAPDLLSINKGRINFVEVKRKNGFTWHRMTKTWKTGIDLHHYKDYCRIADETSIPVWILFLHEGGQAKDSLKSDSGLFGQSLGRLRELDKSGNISLSHCHTNWGNHGMIYWNKECLRHLATIEDLDV